MRILIDWLYREIEYNEELERYDAWPVWYRTFHWWRNEQHEDHFCKIAGIKQKPAAPVWWPDYNNLMPKLHSISKSLKEKTWHDWNIEHYRDYHDEIEDSDVMYFVNKHLWEFETEDEAIEAWHYFLEEKSDWMYETEDYYYREAMSEWKLDDEDPFDVREFFNTYLDIFYVIFDWWHFDQQDVYANIYLMSPWEWNYDLWLGWDFATWYKEYDEVDFEAECFDPNLSFLAYLTQTQWRTLKQVFNRKKQYKWDFIKSLRSELANFFHVCWVTMTLQKHTIESLVKTLCVKDGHLKLAPWHTIGLFAPIVWWWSLFEICLDKDVSLHISYISGIDTKYSRKWFYWYTVNEVYWFSTDVY